jgi:hypothetical protein
VVKCKRDVHHLPIAAAEQEIHYLAGSEKTDAVVVIQFKRGMKGI